MPVLVYSLLRLLLIVVVLGALWLLGLRHWLALAGFAAIIGAALSYLMLSRQRDASARYLAERAEARRRAGDDEEFEDAVTEDEALPGGDDALAAEGETPPAEGGSSPAGTD